MAEPTWLSYADALAFEALTDAIAAGDVRWQAAVEAAAEYVQDRRPDLVFTDATTVPAMVRLGTSRLAHRWHERASSPLGQAQFSEFGGLALRQDPDIAKMLGLGPEGKFQFGAGAPLVVIEP